MLHKCVKSLLHALLVAHNINEAEPFGKECLNSHATKMFDYEIV